MTFTQSPLSNFKMRGLLSIMITCCIYLTSSAQVSILDLGHGEHDFISSYSDADLYFYLFDDGYHSFEAEPTHFFESTSPNPVVYHASPYDDDDIAPEYTGNPTSTILGPTIAPAEIDNVVQVKRSWNLVEDKENFFILMFENTSNCTWSGTVEFHFESSNTEITANDILDDYNNGWVSNRIYHTSSSQNGTDRMYEWTYTDLEPGDQRFIYIPAQCIKPAFTQVKTYGVIHHNVCDPRRNSSDSESHLLTSIVSNFPHDPNMIIPMCDHFGYRADDLANTEYDIVNADKDIVTIPYRIYFQNDGKDPAEHIVVKYGTDPAVKNITLDDSSFDDCYMRWGTSSSKTRATFFFDYIYLPGMAQSTPPATVDETIGWVDFTVCYSKDKLITSPYCIESLIAIHFDHEDPVMADTEVCHIGMHRGDVPKANCNKFSCPPQGAAWQYLGELPIRGRSSDVTSLKEDLSLDFHLYPNPSTTTLFIDGLQFHEDISINVIDIYNRVLKSRIEYNSRIDVSELPAGIYNIVVQKGSELKVKQFVKL